MLRNSAAGWLIVLLPALLLSVDNTRRLRGFSAFELLEIENHRNRLGQKVPDEFMPGLRQEMLHAVAALDLFHRVEDYEDPDVPAPAKERV